MEEFEATGVMTLAEAEKLYTLKREKGSVIIIRYKDDTSPDADVVIPRVIGKSPVTGININTFGGNENIRSVTIPEGVKTIGEFAFDRCSNLQSVTLPKSLREMALGVFTDCKRLESITIPGSLKYIPAQCFCGCSGLTSVTIGKGVKAIGVHAFCECNIENLTIPEGVTEIGQGAFGDCRKLWEVIIPESVTEIGGRAFQGCGKLQSVTIPESVKKIGSDAFKDTPWRERLGALVVINHCLLNYLGEEKDVILPEGLKEIGDNTFQDCAGIQSVTIPDSVVEIGDWAFSKCENLRSITIPENVTRLGMSAFHGCKSLRSVTIPGGIKEICYGAFDGCEKLQNVAILEGVASIGCQAFYGCVNLTDVTIPASVREIDRSAFTYNPEIGIVIIMKGLTIHAPAGSYAEQYARENDIKFQPLRRSRHHQGKVFADGPVNAASALRQPCRRRRERCSRGRGRWSPRRCWERGRDPGRRWRAGSRRRSRPAGTGPSRQPGQGSDRSFSFRSFPFVHIFRQRATVAAPVIVSFYHQFPRAEKFKFVQNGQYPIFKPGLSGYFVAIFGC